MERIVAIDEERAFYRQQYIDLFDDYLNDKITPDEFDTALNGLWQETKSHPDQNFHIAFSEENEIIREIFDTEDLRRSIRRARKRLERIIW